MKRRELLVGAAVTAGSAVVAAACGAVGISSSGEAKSKDPVKIGLLVPLTTENALLGKSLLNGTTMAVEDVNAAGGIGGRKIELLTSDIGNNNTMAVNALQEVNAKDPVAVIGHAWSTMVIAQNEAVKQKGIPFSYSASSVNLSKQGNPWTYRITTNDGVMAEAAAAYVVDTLGAKRIGILHSNEEFGIAGRDVIVKGLKERSITPVAVEAHGSADKDVSAQLLNLKKAGAEIIVGWSFPVPTSLTLRQMKELNIGLPYLGGRSMALAAVLNLSKPDELDGAYGAVDSVVTADTNLATWTKRYADKFGQPADFFAAAHYDNVVMLKSWIEKAGTKPDALMKEILGTRGYKGISNTFDFDATGECVKRAVIMRYKGSTPQILKVVETK